MISVIIDDGGRITGVIKTEEVGTDSFAFRSNIISNRSSSTQDDSTYTDIQVYIDRCENRTPVASGYLRRNKK